MTRAWVLLAGALIFATGCPPQPKDTPPPTDDTDGDAITVPVAGTIQGLEGIGFALTLNAPGVVETLDIPAQATTFTFSKGVTPGGSYEVFISEDPSSPRQTCSLSGSSGLVPDGGVTGISVECTTLKASIGGKIVGLTGTGLVIRNDIGATETDLTIAADQQSYAFGDLPDGTLYTLSVVSHPAGLFCRLPKNRESGEVDASRNVVTLDVTCEPAYSLSGTVSGLPAATSVALALSSDAGPELLPVESTSGDAPFTFVKRLPAMAAYSVTVAAQPPGRRCTARLPAAAGNVGMQDVTGISVVCVGKATPTFVNAPRFTDFVSVAMPTNACDMGSPAAHRGDCMHAGERRSVFVPAVLTCPTTAPTDNLGVFDWGCKPATGGIELFSRGFRAGKRLADLLDIGVNLAWKKNFVRIVENGVNLDSVESADWWPNALARLDNSGNVPANEDATIRIVTTATGAGGNVSRVVTVTDDHVVVVIAPNVSLVDVTTGAPVAVDWSGSFGWFEGTIASSAVKAIRVQGERFVTLRGLRLVGGGVTADYGLSIEGAAFGHTVQDAQLAAFAVQAISVQGDEHLLKDVAAYNTHGLALSGNGHALVDSQVTAIDGTGVVANGSDYFVANLLVANGDGKGIVATTPFSSFWNVAVMNARPTALELHAADDSEVETLGVFATTGYVDFSGNSDRVRFSGRIALGGATGAPCVGLSGTTGNNIDATGAVAGTGIVSQDVLDATQSFVGAVTSDTRNTTQTPTPGAGFDWFNFDNVRRAWGKQKGAAAFGDVALAGACTANCQIWDWSLLLTSLALRGVNPSPTSVAQPVPVTTHTASTGPITYVRHALEIFGDGVGNDNGYCEANERCMHMPNIGRMQGRGAITEAAPQTIGGVANVTLLTAQSF